MTRLGVIDYGMGNRRSVEKALEHVGADVRVTSDHDELRDADGLVLPGVGAFPQAMRNLEALDLPELIRELVGEGTPLLGICIGQALDEALGDRSGISRFGQATVPMDEARASCAIDVSGRGLCAFEAALPPGAIGNFDHELVEEFFRALAMNGRLTLHLTVERGTNAHHMIEAAFKSLARALRAAVVLDAAERGIPSTKGTLV